MTPPVSDPYAPREGVLARSWRLTARAWDVILHDRTALLLAAVVGALAAGIALALFWLSGFAAHPAQRGHLVLAGLVAYWPSLFVGSFLNVALAATAAEAMDGGHLTLRQALAVPARRVGQVLLWSLLATGIGIALQEIAARIPWGGRIASWLLGSAWSLVSLFAIPVLALEGCTATGCVRRAGGLLKGRWGTGVGGSLAIGAWMVVAVVPVAFVVGVVAAAAPASEGTAITTGVALLALIDALAGAVRNVFAVALYRYAASDRVVGGFAEGDLRRPFRAKRRLFQRG